MDADRAAERDFVVRTAQENDVKFIRLWFTDIPVSYTHLPSPRDLSTSRMPSSA